MSNTKTSRRLPPALFKQVAAAGTAAPGEDVPQRQAGGQDNSFVIDDTGERLSRVEAFLQAIALGGVRALASDGSFVRYSFDGEAPALARLAWLDARAAVEVGRDDVEKAAISEAILSALVLGMDLGQVDIDGELGAAIDADRKSRTEAARNSRHKDSRADCKAVQQWFIEHRAEFVGTRTPDGNKERAADKIFELRFVSASRATIRRYLEGL